MMARLAPPDRSGAYVRPQSAFRASVDEEGGYPAESGRYRLLVGSGCPWAHRTLVVRALKGLEATVAVRRVVPAPTEGGWVFETPFEGHRALADLYRAAYPGYSGRSTVPVLWDDRSHRIVNNESAEIVVILNRAFDRFAARPGLDLQPEALKREIDTWNERIYTDVNDGVYRCGFSQSQRAYDEAVERLFSTLDAIDSVLTTRRYLCGDTPTLADVRLFPTLVRFDLVYHGLFKCNRYRIRDYPHLWGYLRDFYQLPGVAATCDFEAIRHDYYGNLFPLNPGGIIPVGPAMSDLDAPHDREGVGRAKSASG